MRWDPVCSLPFRFPKDSEVTGLLETNVDLKDGENSQRRNSMSARTESIWCGGEALDLSKDPLAENRITHPD